MDRARLAYLEKRYWEGKTSLEEENELKTAALSGSDEVSASLIGIFEVTSLAHNVALDDDFDAAFWQKAGVQNKDNQVARVFTLSVFMRYAAIGIILLGISGVIWTLILKDDHPEEVAQTEVLNVDTYDDPQVAFEETKKALMYASQKLNEGSKPLGEIKRFYNAKMSIAGMSADTDTMRTNNS